MIWVDQHRVTIRSRQLSLKWPGVRLSANASGKHLLQWPAPRLQSCSQRPETGSFIIFPYPKSLEKMRVYFHATKRMAVIDLESAILPTASISQPETKADGPAGYKANSETRDHNSLCVAPWNESDETRKYMNSLTVGPMH